jgi:hypothetical protein
MDSPERTNVRRRVRRSIAAAAFAALAAAIAGASAASPSAPSESSCTQVTCVFVLDKGKFTGFDAPAPQDLVRINNRGQIVGGTREAVADEGFRGFLRDRRGDFTRIDFPGAAGTQPNDINDRRQIVGTYSNANSCTGCADDKRDFLLDRGRFTTIHVPGAAQTQGRRH